MTKPRRSAPEDPDRGARAETSGSTPDDERARTLAALFGKPEPAAPARPANRDATTDAGLSELFRDAAGGDLQPARDLAAASSIESIFNAPAEAVAPVERAAESDAAAEPAEPAKPETAAESLVPEPSPQVGEDSAKSADDDEYIDHFAVFLATRPPRHPVDPPLEHGPYNPGRPDEDAVSIPPAATAGRAPVEDLSPTTDALATLFPWAQNPPAAAEDEPGTAATAILPEPATIAAAAATAPATPPGLLDGQYGRRERTSWFHGRRRIIAAVAASVVLIAGVVAGSVLVSQRIANDEALAAATAALDESIADAQEADARADLARADYDAAATQTQATLDAAAPALAAMEGISDPALLAAVVAARDAVVVVLDVPPAEADDFEDPDVDRGSLERIETATAAADDHTTAVNAVTSAIRTAIDDLNAAATARRDAIVALGANLPLTAAAIIDDNPRADTDLADAVAAAAAAVGAAQQAGGSGDAEMLAYAAAVQALRDDQTAAVSRRSTVQPTPSPVPTTAPAPAPAPTTAPTVAPSPTPVPDPSSSP